MKTFLEHVEEEEIDDVVYKFYELIEKQLIGKGVKFEDRSIGVKFFGLNKEGKTEAEYNLALLWTGYIPDIIKTLNKIESVLKNLNSYPDMIIMNWFILGESLEIKIIWNNFIKTDLYKSLKTVSKFNL